MSEANVLYSVTAVVVLGLIVWVALVLKTAKEPWARPRVPHPEPVEREGEPSTEAIDADATAKATPVALAAEAEGKAKAAAKDEEKADGSAEA